MSAHLSSYVDLSSEWLLSRPSSRMMYTTPTSQLHKSLFLLWLKLINLNSRCSQFSNLSCLFLLRNMRASSLYWINTFKPIQSFLRTISFSVRLKLNKPCPCTTHSMSYLGAHLSQVKNSGKTSMKVLSTHMITILMIASRLGLYNLSCKIIKQMSVRIPTFIRI